MVQVFHPQNDRPTLLDVWTNYQFDKLSLAFLAGVDASTVNDMMASQPVQAADAQKVLFHLSHLLEKDFSLDTVHIVLKRDESNKSDVARTLARIDAEYNSAQQGLYGVAEKGRHSFLNNSLERIADTIIGLPEEERIQVLIHLNNESADTVAP